MPYNVTWYDDEKSIIVFDISGSISWDAFVIATDQTCEMIDSVAHDVYIIFDDHVGMPKGNPFPRFRECIEKVNERDNFVLSVTVAGSRLTLIVEAVVELTIRFHITNGRENHFVETFEQALAIIAKDRAEKNGASSNT